MAEGYVMLGGFRGAELQSISVSFRIFELHEVNIYAQSESNLKATFNTGLLQPLSTPHKRLIMMLITLSEAPRPVPHVQPLTHGEDTERITHCLSKPLQDPLVNCCFLSPRLNYSLLPGIFYEFSP